MKHRGSCHCGRVAIEVEGEIQSGMACNCSICQRRGSILWFVPRAAMTLLTPPENAQVYEFNKHVIRHHFCKTCGILPFALGTDPKGNEMAAINLRCIEGLDLDKVPVQHFDGRSL
jgi:hypothetical protein